MDTRDCEIGKKIKQYRKGKMTQQELAERIGKTESSVRKYEKGLVTIPLDVLENIASALGVTPFALMGAEYLDKKHPEIAKECAQYYAFNDYLRSLGYEVKEDEIEYDMPIKEYMESEVIGESTLSKEDLEAGFIPMTYFNYVISNGSDIITLEEGEFDQLRKNVNEYIAFQLWNYKKEKDKK